MFVRLCVHSIAQQGIVKKVPRRCLEREHPAAPLAGLPRPGVERLGFPRLFRRIC